MFSCTLPPQTAIPPPYQTRKENVTERSSNGVMEQGSGKVWKAGAHPASVVVVDVAIFESHITGFEPEASTLPNKERKGHRKFIQRGDG